MVVIEKKYHTVATLNTKYSVTLLHKAFLFTFAEKFTKKVDKIYLIGVAMLPTAGDKEPF